MQVLQKHYCAYAMQITKGLFAYKDLVGKAKMKKRKQREHPMHLSASLIKCDTNNYFALSAPLSSPLAGHATEHTGLQRIVKFEVS